MSIIGFDPEDHPDDWESVKVTELVLGDEICYVTTMFGLHDSQKVNLATVEMLEFFNREVFGAPLETVRVHHSGGPTDADIDDTVWRRKHG